MTLQVTDLQELQPWEKVSFLLPFIKTIAVSDPADTISSVAFAVFDETTDPTFATDLSATHVWMEDFDSTGETQDVNCGIFGSSEGTYRLRARVQMTSGARYENDYRFRVREV